MFNIDREFIEQLKDDGVDLWTISQWANWLEVLPGLQRAIDQIRESFRGVQLENGVGLLEANGLDDYADESELARLRNLDERTNWESLKPELLSKYHSAPMFFDSKGFHFHLPAYLIAELNDQHDYGFVELIFEKHPKTGGWIDLLNSSQAESLVAVLALVKQHPYYNREPKKIEFAIERFAAIAGNQA